jgi:hypothetical protein
VPSRLRGLQAAQQAQRLRACAYRSTARVCRAGKEAQGPRQGLRQGRWGQGTAAACRVQVPRQGRQRVASGWAWALGSCLGCVTRGWQRSRSVGRAARASGRVFRASPRCIAVSRCGGQGGCAAQVPAQCPRGWLRSRHRAGRALRGRGAHEPHVARTQEAGRCTQPSAARGARRRAPCMVTWSQRAGAASKRAGARAALAPAVRCDADKPPGPLTSHLGPPGLLHRTRVAAQHVQPGGRGAARAARLTSPMSASTELSDSRSHCAGAFILIGLLSSPCLLVNAAAGAGRAGEPCEGSDPRVARDAACPRPPLADP